MGASNEEFINLREKEFIISCTVKTKGLYLTQLERLLNEGIEDVTLIDYRVIQDTKDLYDNNEHFRKLVKLEKEAKKKKQEFINKYL